MVWVWLSLGAFVLAAALWNRGDNLVSLAVFGASAGSLVFIIDGVRQIGDAYMSSGSLAPFHFWVSVALAIASVPLLATALQAASSLVLRSPLKHPAAAVTLVVVGYAPLVLLGIVYLAFHIFLLGE